MVPQRHYTSTCSRRESPSTSTSSLIGCDPIVSRSATTRRSLSGVQRLVGSIAYPPVVQHGPTRLHTIVVRHFGVYIDSDLSMWSHVQRTVSCCFAVLRQLRRQIPTTAFRSVIAAPVLSWLDYCNSVLFELPSYIKRLQSVQNAAARLVFRIRCSEHSYH